MTLPVEAVINPRVEHKPLNPWELQEWELLANAELIDILYLLSNHQFEGPADLHNRVVSSFANLLLMHDPQAGEAVVSQWEHAE